MKSIDEPDTSKKKYQISSKPETNHNEVVDSGGSFLKDSNGHNSSSEINKFQNKNGISSITKLSQGKFKLNEI